jgi:hypothetical protein
MRFIENSCRAGWRRGNALDLYYAKDSLSAWSSAILVFRGLPQTLIPVLRHETRPISSFINSRAIRRHVASKVLQSDVKYTAKCNLEEGEHDVMYSLALRSRT